VPDRRPGASNFVALMVRSQIGRQIQVSIFLRIADLTV